MVAARLANMPEGRPGKETLSSDNVSLETAASELNVGKASVARAMVAARLANMPVRRNWGNSATLPDM
jgi:hypothetical protein